MATDILRHRDLEYDDLERNELLSGEPRYVEDEVRNSTFAMIFGGVAGLVCLVAMILCWILYFRERTRTFLWHAIWLTCATLFAGLCAAWGAMAGGAVRTGKQPPSMLSLVVFLGGLVLMVYLFATTMWLVFYRPIHFSYLIGLRTNDDLWNKRMSSGSSFEEGWKSSRRMMWWVTFFTLIAGVCFGFCAYAARSIVWNRFQLTRIGLYAACLFMVVSGAIVVYWAKECKLYVGLNKDGFTLSIVNALEVLGWISIALGALNAILNMVKFKFTYFLLGILLMLLTVILVSCTGSLWREIRVSQRDRKENSCMDTLVPIHESKLEKICINGGKYLGANENCSKEYLVNRWEGGTSELRYLNPGCCELGKSFYYLPFMYLAFWATVLTLWVIIALSCNFYLADTSEYLSNANKPTGVIDYIGLGLVLATLIGFVLYYIFKKKLNAIEFGSNSDARSYRNPEANKIQDLDLVPSSVITSVNPPINTNGCQNFSTVAMIKPVFSDTDPVCTTNCVERVAILSRNGQIVPPVDPSGASFGSSTSRLAFFPDCRDSTQSYIFLYGTNQQITAALNTINICPESLNDRPEIFFYHDQVPANTIGSNGLRAGEDGVSQLTNADGINCGTGFDSTTTTCQGKCTIDYTLPINFGSTILKGALFFIDNGVTKTNVHAGVSVSATANGNPIGNNALIMDGGIFTIDGIPRFNDNEYYLTLNFKDSKGVFLPKNVAVKVSKTSPIPDEVSGGRIQLLTVDGKVCAPTDATCITAQKRSNGAVVFSIKDSTNPAVPAALEGATLSVNSEHTLDGTTVKSGTSDATGTGKIEAIPFDAYTLVATKNGFLPAARRIDLQAPTVTVLPFYLRPTTSDDDMRIVADVNEPNADFDLKMNIRSDKKFSCQVSPYNKYCGYSAHLNDVMSGAGQEVIAVKRLAVAEYLSFVAPSSPYSGTCSAGGVVNDAIIHYADWDWKKYKTTRPIELLNIAVSTIGGATSSPTAANTDPVFAAIMTAIPKLFPVETKQQAAIEKFVINKNGREIPVAERHKVITDITSSSVIGASNTQILSSNTVNSDLPDKAGTVVTKTTTYVTRGPAVEETGKSVVATTTYTNGSIAVDTHKDIELDGVDTNDLSGAGWGGKLEQTNPDKSGFTKSEDYTEITKNGNIEYLYLKSLLTNGLGETTPLNHTERHFSVYNQFSKANSTNDTINKIESYKTNGTTMTVRSENVKSTSADIQSTTDFFIVDLKHKTADDTYFESKKISNKKNGVNNDYMNEATITDKITTKSNGQTKTTTDYTKEDSKPVTGVVSENTKTILTANSDKSSEQTVTSTVTKTQGTNKETAVKTVTVKALANGGEYSNSKLTTTKVQDTLTITEEDNRESNYPTKGSLTKQVTRTSRKTVDSKVPATYQFISTDKVKESYDNKTILDQTVTENSVYSNNGAGSTTKKIEKVYIFDHKGNNTKVTYTYITEGTYDAPGTTATSLTTNTWSVLVYDYKKGTKVEYRSDKPTPIETKGDVLATRRALASLFSTAVHEQATSDSNYLLVNCFTGFGKVSVVEQGLFTVDEPTFENCIPILNANLPQYTIAKLRQQVGN